MIVLSFLSAVVCYREYLHIGVGVLPAFCDGPAKSCWAGSWKSACWPPTCSCLAWGIKLVQTTWYQSIAEFPIVTAGMAYLPIPVGGALTALFVIERLLTQKFFAEPESRGRKPDFDRIGAGRMDIFILIGSFTIVCLMGMPVAYALGMAAILGCAVEPACRSKP